MSDAGISVPLGAVLAYAGNLSGSQLNASGWALCDGARYRVSDNRDLFGVLGTCNGGDGRTYFDLPDYQGYFLRGVDSGAHVDPDAGSRTAPTSGGATGDEVGSVQAWATANARSPFSAAVPHVPTDDHHAYESSDCTMLLWGQQSCASSGGGDHETRPCNAYVRFIIKISAGAGIPTGAVVPYAGNVAYGSKNLQEHYLPCDGSLLQPQTYPDLFNAIGTAHGATADGFNLPDYHGRFLRGATGTTTNDPDAASRTAMNVGGARGPNVGSVQEWATGAPKSPFSFTVNVGTNQANSSTVAGHDNSAWTGDSTQVPMTASGGDKESRPTNAYVDFFILARSDANTSDIFPIGAIIAIPGNALPPAGQWLHCNGATVENSDQYRQLYGAIGHDNGGDDQKFNLPDYKGRFLRGCDRRQGRDPDASSRTPAQAGGQQGDNVGSVQAWATGKPTQDIVTQVQHLPTADHHNALALGGNRVANWGSTATPGVSGGDNETRPINAYVEFYIKYALASSTSAGPRAE